MNAYIPMYLFHNMYLIPVMQIYISKNCVKLNQFNNFN